VGDILPCIVLRFHFMRFDVSLSLYFVSLLASFCISLELEICVSIRRVGVLEINPFRPLTIYFPFPLDGKCDYDQL